MRKSVEVNETTRDMFRILRQLTLLIFKSIPLFVDLHISWTNNSINFSFTPISRGFLIKNRSKTHIPSAKRSLLICNHLVKVRWTNAGKAPVATNASFQCFTIDPINLLPVLADVYPIYKTIILTMSSHNCSVHAKYSSRIPSRNAAEFLRMQYTYIKY